MIGELKVIGYNELKVMKFRGDDELNQKSMMKVEVVMND